MATVGQTTWHGCSPWRAALASTTVRRFGRALAIALGVLAFGVVLYVVEKYVFQPPRRFVENPGSVMMRAGGLAHFWMGWLYLFTSPKIRNRTALLRLFGLTVLGVSVCLLSARWGGLSNHFLYLFFFCYFFLHEMRDERDLYLASATTPARDAFLLTFTSAATIFLTAIICAGYLVHGIFVKRRPFLVDCPTWIYLVMLVLFTTLVVWSVRRCWQMAQRHYQGLTAALGAHAPLVVVYTGLFVVILLGGVLGSVSFNLLILIHGGTWIMFILQQMHARPRRVPRTAWRWLRDTPTGFLILHMVMFISVLVLLGLRVHLWQRTGLLSELVERGSFPYWSIMHITLAFWRPK